MLLREPRRASKRGHLRSQVLSPALPRAGVTERLSQQPRMAGEDGALAAFWRSAPAAGCVRGAEGSTARRELVVFQSGWLGNSSLSHAAGKRNQFIQISVTPSPKFAREDDSSFSLRLAKRCPGALRTEQRMSECPHAYRRQQGETERMGAPTPPSELTTSPGKRGKFSQAPLTYRDLLVLLGNSCSVWVVGHEASSKHH